MRPLHSALLVSATAAALIAASPALAEDCFLDRNNNGTIEPASDDEGVTQSGGSDTGGRIGVAGVFWAYSDCPEIARPEIALRARLTRPRAGLAPDPDRHRRQGRPN